MVRDMPTWPQTFPSLGSGPFVPLAGLLRAPVPAAFTGARIRSFRLHLSPVPPPPQIQLPAPADRRKLPLSPAPAAVPSPPHPRSASDHGRSHRVGAWSEARSGLAARSHAKGLRRALPVLMPQAVPSIEGAGGGRPRG